MNLIFENAFSKNYHPLISKKADFLLDFFNFDPETIEPGKIEIAIFNDLKEFTKKYEFENNKSLPFFVVGFAGKNGRIFILDKKLFPKQGHREEEFERVVVHELCHVFIRRMLHPKHTFIWIEEGLCEFLSFGDYPLKIKKIVDFREIETSEGWRKHNAYQQAKGFFKYLSKNYGDKKIVEFIKKIKVTSERKAFKEVFGKEINEIQEKFFNTLKNEKTLSSGNSLQ